MNMQRQTNSTTIIHMIDFRFLIFPAHCSHCIFHCLSCGECIVHSACYSHLYKSISVASRDSARSVCQQRLHLSTEQFVERRYQCGTMLHRGAQGTSGRLSRQFKKLWAIVQTDANVGFLVYFVTQFLRFGALPDGDHRMQWMDGIFLNSLLSPTVY